MFGCPNPARCAKGRDETSMSQRISEFARFRTLGIHGWSRNPRTSKRDNDKTCPELSRVTHHSASWRFRLATSTFGPPFTFHRGARLRRFCGASRTYTPFALAAQSLHVLVSAHSAHPQRSRDAQWAHPASAPLTLTLNPASACSALSHPYPPGALVRRSERR